MFTVAPRHSFAVPRFEAKVSFGNLLEIEHELSYPSYDHRNQLPISLNTHLLWSNFLEKSLTIFGSSLSVSDYRLDSPFSGCHPDLRTSVTLSTALKPQRNEVRKFIPQEQQSLEAFFVVRL
jgi:hypothetical protein